MAQIILDTNALIDIWNNNRAANQKMPDFKRAQLCISICTYVEFLAPVPLRLKNTTRKFLTKFEIVPYSLAAIQAAKAVAYKFETPSTQFIDLLIAANAIGIKAPVYTSNTKDFKKYPLKLI